MKNKYYHLTDCKYAPKIMREGIKADRYGQIFVFTDMLVANTIAENKFLQIAIRFSKSTEKGLAVKS